MVELTPPQRFLSYPRLLLWSGLAVASFYASYLTKATAYAGVIYLFALLQLAQAEKWRKAAYSGLVVGLLLAVGGLTFFWRIFGAGAVALWYVYAFWIGVFVALARLCLLQFRGSWGWVLLPFLWTGLEYFRSELYYLKFSWLNIGYAFSGWLGLAPVRHAGMYGLGFALMSIASVGAFLWRRSRLRASLALAVGVGLMSLWSWGSAGGDKKTAAGSVQIAGIQMEQPSEDEVLSRLNKLLDDLPQTELVVLSEYTFNEPIPKGIAAWCREHRKYLIIGGTDPAPGSQFYDTAFVIGPSGEVVFRQAKSVPIQFFKDGLPAREQRLWNSPWGKLGICICYDLSYTRVTDRLVKLGAQGLIVPTMDVMDWGLSQHRLHARVAPLRAAEYGLPIFRLASSGISQSVGPSGTVRAATSCPGRGEVLAGTFELALRGHLPWDRWLAPFCSGLTGLLILYLAFARWLSRGKPGWS